MKRATEKIRWVRQEERDANGDAVGTNEVSRLAGGLAPGGNAR